MTAAKIEQFKADMAEHDKRTRELISTHHIGIATSRVELQDMESAIFLIETRLKDARQLIRECIERW